MAHADIIGDADEFRRKMFGHHDAALSHTDPEFIQIFENFAFGDVPRDSVVSDEDRFISILAALMGSHGADAFRTMLPAALEVGVDPSMVKEMVYQGVPYLGLSRVLPYILICNEVFRQRSIKLPLPPQKTATRDEHVRKGNDIQVEIWGEEMRDNWEREPKSTEHIRRWLAGNCFGDYYTRGGLDLDKRELATLCFLASQGGCDPQVEAHVRGNLNLGREPQYLIDVISQMVPYIGYPRVLNTIAIIEKVAAE